jgi:hypothetical protein
LRVSAEEREQLEDAYARWLKQTDERIAAAFDRYDQREAICHPPAKPVEVQVLIRIARAGPSGGQ